MIRYNVVDEDGNIFLPGCFDKAIEESKGKIKILENHSTEHLIKPYPTD